MEESNLIPTAPTTAAVAATTTQRSIAALPKVSLKLPILPPFDTPESIIQALASRETAVLIAGLLQIEKRGLAIVSLEQPRAIKDPLLDYLSKYPTVDGLFAAWDTAHKTNNSQLSTAVLSALTVLIRVISTDQTASEPELIRRLLSSYGSHLDRALNPGRNDVTVAALKLLNVVVAFGSGRFARRMFAAMSWSPKIVTRLFRTRLKEDTTRDPLRKPDIRTLLTMLILALLSAGDSRLKGDVIDTKGLVSGMIKGLAEDSEIVVNYVLVTLYNEVAMDRSIPLDTRRSVFDENCINELVKIYDVVPEDSDSDQNVLNSIHRFFLALTEWLASQIIDSNYRSFGPQKVLGILLRTLKVTEDSQQRELGLHILSRAPILAGAFWARFPASLDPRLSSRWISAVTFATQVVSLPVSPLLTASLSSSLSAPPSVTSVMDNILPPSLTKTWYSKALQHESPLVSFLASIFLLASLQKAAQILAVIAESSSRLEEVPTVGRWASLGTRLREHLRTILPDPQTIVALMQKTAVVVSAPVVKKPSRKSSSKKVVVEKEEEEKDDDVVGRHLRTNVALRLLWSYHRVVPSLIATLRFDFAKLPQAHVARTDVEGIRAISSAYALRLAAIHSSTLIWSRPGDHYKNTLVPLFQLYRTPSTPSNRRLLLSILGRLLSTPILFGESLGEASIWLDALPTPTQTVIGTSSSDDSAPVLDFFERCVQKTLTAPIKVTTSDEMEVDQEEKIVLSPLLKNIMLGLPSEMKGCATAERRLLLGEFLTKVVLGYISHSERSELVPVIVSQLSMILLQEKSVEMVELARLLGDYVTALVTDTEVEDDEELVKRIEGEKSFLSSISPIRSNVFASIASISSLELCLQSMSTELILLHVRPIDLRDVAVTKLVISIIVERSAWLSAVQIMLHRYITPERNETDFEAFVGFFRLLFASCQQERTVTKMKDMLFGEKGLVRAFTVGDVKSTPFSSISTLLSSVLSHTDSSDARLAKGYCDLVFADNESIPVKAKPSKKPVVMSSRLKASATLLRFFDDDKALSFLDTLLSRVSVATIDNLDDSTKSVISASLSRAESLPLDNGLQTLWTTHFLRLLRLSTKADVASAAAVLVRGAQALVPFPLSAETSTGLHQHSKGDEGWKDHIAEWTSEILSQDSLQVEQARVLAALIYRSAGTRSSFIEWLAKSSNVEGAEAALRAVLEVAKVKEEAIEIPASIALTLVEQLLSSTSTSVLDAQRSVYLLCDLSSETATKVNERLLEKIAELERDSYTSSMLVLLSDLTTLSESFKVALEAYVNGSFSWLVRRFAEDAEDGQAVLDFCRQLRMVCEMHTSLVHKSHLLDPVISAVIAKRLDQVEPIALAAALCSGHSWKVTEVTRHLNNIFAHEHFKPRILLNDDSARRHQSVVIRLVIALSSSSIPAAAAARVVEKLVPFYGATLSTDDQLILTLFHRVELVTGTSLSIALRAWNSSLELGPPEATRAGTLAALQVGYVRRSWSRVCASTRTTFPTEYANITYDPTFILPFLQRVIAEEEMKGQDWLSLLESGVLGIAIAALASTSTSLRTIAQATLADTLIKIQTMTFREKDEIVLVLSHARNCIYSSEGEAIPAIIALFLSHCIYLIATPESTMYPAFSRFLLQRPLLDQRDVPMFYLLFFTTSEEPLEDHRWLLKFLAEGLVRSQDWKIFRRRQTYELLASFLQSNRQDPTTRKLVLQFLVRATSLPQAAREMLSRNGLLGWIASQTPVDATERRLMISIIENIVDVLSQDKLATIVDALDTLTGSCGLNDVSSSEVASICSIVFKLSTRLPTTSSLDASHRLALDRARDLLSFIAIRLPTDAASRRNFYAAVMLSAFARSSLPETKVDRELFSLAVSVGIASEVEGVRENIIRSICG